MPKPPKKPKNPLERMKRRLASKRKPLTKKELWGKAVNETLRQNIFKSRRDEIGSWAFDATRMQRHGKTVELSLQERVNLKSEAEKRLRASQKKLIEELFKDLKANNGEFSKKALDMFGHRQDELSAIKKQFQKLGGTL